MSASTTGTGPRSHAAERAKEDRQRKFDEDLTRAMSQPQAGSIFSADYEWPSGDRWQHDTTSTTTNEPAKAAG